MHPRARGGRRGGLRSAPPRPQAQTSSVFCISQAEKWLQ